MVYIGFKTFSAAFLIIALANFRCFGAIIKYISYAGIMDTSPEIQFYNTVSFCVQEIHHGRVA